MARTSFPDSLPVIHGAPLLHRPRMAREDRLTLARCVTECAVGRAREADMRPLHAGPPEGHSFYGRDGVLWALVRLASPSVRPMALTPGQFADMLARDADPLDQANLAFRRYFARTPLAPRDAVAGRHVAFEAKRAQGEDLPARGPGLVLDDGRDRCAADLRRFLADEVLVTESAVYLRCPPLLRNVRPGKGEPAVFALDPARTFEPLLGEVPSVPHRYLRAAPLADEIVPPAWPGARESARRAPGRARPERVLGACAAALAKGGWLRDHGDADLAMLANTLPGWIVGQAAAYDAVERGRGVEPSLIQELRGDAILGMTGAVADRQSTLARSSRALRAHGKWLRDRGEGQKADYARGLVAYVERCGLPRVSALPEADLDALSGLGPTP